MDLICSIYFDLPSSLQAFLFATINSTQKPVDKSLAYQLFGYELTKEKYESWSPDKLAMSLCKKLNEDSLSPLFRNIRTIDQIENSQRDWDISVSAIVDSILRLISTNPRRDKIELHKLSAKERKRGKLPDNSAPLRELYLQYKDNILYKIIMNFFIAASKSLKQWGDKETVLTKTVGIQGLFDVLRYYIIEENRKKKLEVIDFKVQFFNNKFNNCNNVNYSSDFFLKYSGVGRARLRNIVLISGEFIESGKLVKSKDISDYKEILKEKDLTNYQY